ncbi:protein stoned-B [Diaphorina citri]|uniref:Protein stoned-B n=1 Tax=Diaphorina citri TaxID=121845 RepID=A0A3Q0IWV0_DIACI|nr:protein stoned-B [Diaphorina citri]
MAFNAPKNPFLFTEEELRDEPAEANNINPFLINESDLGDTHVTSENPFFNFSNLPSTTNANQASTNPFAFIVEPDEVPDQTNTNNFLFDDPIPDQPSHDATADLLGTFEPIIQQDDLMDNKQDQTPRRPPPPRPVIPPSKETKDLILTVTGHMEATSSHLDRCHAARTPSPTPMRDIHSPSPTPDVQHQNLMGDEDITPIFPQTVSEPNHVKSVTRNLMDDLENSPSIPTEPPKLPPTIPAEPPKLPPSVPSEPPKLPPSIPSEPPKIPPSIPTEPPKIPPQRPPVPPIPEPKVAPSVPARPAPPKILDNKEPPIIPRDSSDLTYNTSTPSSRKASITNPEAPRKYSKENVIDNDVLIQNAINSRKSSQDVVTSRKSSQDIQRITSASQSRKASNEVAPDVFSQQITSTNIIENYTTDSSPFIEDHATAVNHEATAEPIQHTADQFMNLFGTSIGKNEPETAFMNQDDTFGIQPAATDFPEQTISQDTLFSQPPTEPQKENVFAQNDDLFDAFSAKFESVKINEEKSSAFDPFGGTSAFGDAGTLSSEQPSDVEGFGTDDGFDAFLAMGPPPTPQCTPTPTPAKQRKTSADSDEDSDFNVFIRPQNFENNLQPNTALVPPSLAPPPKSPAVPASQDSSPRFNPFDKGDVFAAPKENIFTQPDELNLTMQRTDSQETPPTPLFDEDVSQPLEDFPRIKYDGPGWEMHLRQPNKKKITGQRFWKKVFVKIVYHGEKPVVHLYNKADDKDPFQELPLEPCYSVSEIGAQQYDNFGKIFTVKLQFIFYKERPGVRPGQVTKAERITNKLSQFAAYAIQGDYQGVKEFGSDLRKLGLPVEHAPQTSQLFKIGSHSYEAMKQFTVCIEEALFKLPVHRDRALTYKMEEVQITTVDEIYVEQNETGSILKQIARVRLFFLGFLSGMPDIELGVNDLVRQGKEVVGRHDIIPVVTEEWIRLEGVEFHSCVQQDEYEKGRTIKFKPPDACYIELMRFRVRPPRNRELPLQLKAVMCVTGNKVELRADILVPGFVSRKLGQIPCEDIMVRFPIPECWIYLFRVEKHFRYGSVKSAHRRTGKVKGIERFLGAVDNLEPQLMEVTSGQSKYEHQHRSIVWRMPRLPKEGQGSYTTHNLVCRMALTSYDQIPDDLHTICQYAYVEFTMPATQVSHTTVRSVSISNSDSDVPPEKYVRHLARHEYRVGIEHTQGEGPGDYIAATIKSTPPPIMETPIPQADSDSDSSS